MILSRRLAATTLAVGVRVWVCEHDVADKGISRDSCTFPKFYDNPLS
jgi:hypothetical protein